MEGRRRNNYRLGLCQPDDRCLGGVRLVVVVSVVLFRTALGLRLRGVGEQPDAAETLSVRVNAYRIATVLARGALVGHGGAQLSLGALSVFAEDMSAERGWIAVVAEMLGRANPIYATAACAHRCPSRRSGPPAR